MSEYLTKKIQLFDGINSNPIAPTAEQAGNITYFYQQYNNLIDSLITANTELRNEIDILNEKVNYLDFEDSFFYDFNINDGNKITINQIEKLVLLLGLFFQRILTLIM